MFRKELAFRVNHGGRLRLRVIEGETEAINAVLSMPFRRAPVNGSLFLPDVPRISR